MSLLIGGTGFVGGTLARQHRFDACVSSADIAGVRDSAHDLVVCAGAPGAKWIADRDPAADFANLRRLADDLATLTAGRFVLVSTVDVFADSRGRDEDSEPMPDPAAGYGRNRLWLEGFVRDRFPAALIVRLSGLVGPGLRKNALFDLHHDNAVERIDPRGIFQFYPMASLWADLSAALALDLRLLHLTAAPLAIADVAEAAFGVIFAGRNEDRPPPAYDLQTIHAKALGGTGRHVWSARESLLAIRAYAQSERRSAPLA